MKSQTKITVLNHLLALNLDVSIWSATPMSVLNMFVPGSVSNGSSLNLKLRTKNR